MQIGFYFDQSRCIGCFTCVVACRSWNQLDQEYPDLIQIVSQEQGDFPNVSLSYLFLTCFHCAKPACIPACPDKLLMKREKDGVVIITDHKQCKNCQLCVEACPYDALKMIADGKIDIIKCDLCIDRIDNGQAPACVATCPTEALDAGSMDELIIKYGELRELEGFADVRITYPSIIFRDINPKK